MSSSSSSDVPTKQSSLALMAKKGDFKVIEMDVPQPGADDVLVKIMKTALNPVDWKIQKYGAFIDKFPAVLGSDAAGEVAQVGSNVKNFTVGDRVVFQGFFENSKATFQQYAIVPAEIVARIPSNISLAEAATIPLGLATAAVGFFDKGGLEVPFPGESSAGDKGGILIIGGSGSVGAYAIQLAKLSGLSPILATSSPANHDFLRSLGATHVFDRSPSSSELSSFGVKYAYDSQSLPATQTLAVEALTPNGRLALVLDPSQDASKAAKEKSVTTFHVFGNVHMKREVGIKLYAALTEWLESGKIMPNKVEEVSGGLEGIIEGLKKLEKGVSAVKLVASPFGN